MSARDEAESRWPIRILHLHSSFSLGGKEARAVRLMNLMGDRAHHVILSAVPGALGARAAIDPAIVVDFPADAPALHGTPSRARYRELARYFCDFDLILSYNWGAMDGVMARRLFGARRPDAMPDLIHHSAAPRCRRPRRSSCRRRCSSASPRANGAPESGPA